MRFLPVIALLVLVCAERSSAFITTTGGFRFVSRPEFLDKRADVFGRKQGTQLRESTVVIGAPDDSGSSGERALRITADGYVVKGLQGPVNAGPTYNIGVKKVPLPYAVPPKSLADVAITRASYATVLYPQDTTPKAGIVFGSGFSQVPKSYKSLLRSLCAAGFVIVAPTVWVFDVALPWSNVETVGWTDSPPKKLQSAVIVDMLRSIQWLHDQGIKDVGLCGHSMGGALSMVLPQHLNDETSPLTAIASLSPQLGLVQSTLNPFLTMTKGGTVDKDSCSQLLNAYGTAPVTLLVAADNDIISPPPSISSLYGCMKKSTKYSAEGQVTYKELKDSGHLGYADKLTNLFSKETVLQGRFRLLFQLIFDLISRVLYDKEEWLPSYFHIDYDVQLATSKRVLHQFFHDTLGGQDLSEHIKDPHGPK